MTLNIMASKQIGQVNNEEDHVVGRNGDRVTLNLGMLEPFRGWGYPMAFLRVI